MPPGGQEEPSPPLPFLELPYFNGLGGFTPDGREYAIYLTPGGRTPAPWVNVIAHATFGAMVSESGLGCTWAGNSQSNRLTPWHNDPTSDPQSGSDLPARRTNRRAVDPDCSSHSGNRRLSRPPRPGLHRIRAQQPRHRPGTDRFRSHIGRRNRGHGQSDEAAFAQRFFAPPAPHSYLFRGVAARRNSGRPVTAGEDFE